jgi:DNA helicase II / ATP-dependent DNA helicase PcrA
MEAERVPARLLDGLDEAQRRAVLSDAAPLCIVAPAGSGKTRVLTRRIAARVLTGDADPGHVLALTFTRKAAAELAGRLTALGVRDRVAAGTFNAVAFAQLRRRWADQRRAPWGVLTSPARVLADLLGGPDRLGEARDLATEIDWAQARSIDPSGYEAAAAAAGRLTRVGPAAVAALYERYQEEKRRRRVVDFNDLLTACARAVELGGPFADVQRWTWKHLFVDEFQDVNPLQLRLLEAWRDGRPDLCVVGDPDQAIYGWNGADPGYLREFPERWPGGEVVRLTANHRSTPEVLAAAAGVLRSVPPVATRDGGRDPTVTGLPSDRAEAAAVAEAVVKAARRLGRWSAQAVLTRTRAQHEPIVAALRRAGVPVRTAGSGRLVDHPVVRRALADMAGRGGTVAAAVVDVEGAARSAGTRGEARALAALAVAARQLLALDRAATVDALPDWVAGVGGTADRPAAADGVVVATFHAAKGLEWPVVHVAGVEDGFVPHAWGDEDEERRLLHVAVTRAVDEVHLTWAGRRTVGGSEVERRPSPFLDDLAAGLAAMPVPEPVDWRGEVARRRSRLVAGPAGSGEVLSALRTWRSGVARAAGVAPSAVLGDRVLEEVAARRPSDLAGLLAVPGIGPVRAVRHGPAVLAVLAAEAGPRAS